ncbi:MAG: amidohydrolase family protein [Anaerolineaceae bacterium]|nr:amidohydrolase family protein [Anaerolineaceae bacterium]
MNAKRSVIFLVVCYSLLFASCARTPQTPSPSPLPSHTGAESVTEPISPPQEISFPDSPPKVLEFLTRAEVLSYDDMSSFEENSWAYTKDDVTVSNGSVTITQSGDLYAYVNHAHSFSNGESILMLFKFSEMAEFEMQMERGQWDTDAFFRWGLYKTEDLGTNIFNRGAGLDQQSFYGTLTFVPDRWYYILSVVGEDRGIQYIWEKDNPQNQGYFPLAFESDWVDQEWLFVFQIFVGEIEVDETYILSGSSETVAGLVDVPAFSISGLAGTSAQPEQQETVVPSTPEEFADLIFHNGQVLTMEAGLPIEQALAVKGDAILAVGDNDEILALVGDGTRVIDLAGNTLMPGFIDPHTHIFDSGTSILGMSIEEVQQFAIENGVTSIAGFMNEGEIGTMQSMNADGSLHLRTNVYLYATGACGEPFGTWYEQFAPTREFGELLRINGIKIFTDGGTCEYPAVTQQTHPGAGLGNLWFTDQQLKDMVLEAHNAGYQVAIHALGDRAIKQAQDAIIYANDGPENPLRHRIEHNYYLSDDLLPRYMENGILPIIFGQFPTCAVAGLDRTDYWKATIARWRELVDANPMLPIAAKSDTPYVGQEIPLLSLYSLTTMREVAPDGSICMPPAWLSERTITIEEALPMVTINAAYTLFRDNEVGSLESGKLADLIILSGNPLNTPPEDLLNLEVWMTMIAGDAEYCAIGHDDLCP